MQHHQNLLKGLVKLQTVKKKAKTGKKRKIDNFIFDRVEVPLLS